MHVIIQRGHSTRRLAQRGITVREVKEVLQNHDQSYPGDRCGTVYIGTTSAGRRLAVVAITPPNDPSKRILKTAYEY
jgi:hypothetical protein